MDKVLSFFSAKLGLHFLEFDSEAVNKTGVRASVCYDVNLHFIAPVFPLADNAAPPIKAHAERVQKRDMMVLAFTFFFKNEKELLSGIEKAGLSIIHQYKDDETYHSLGMVHFTEYVLDSRDTFGLSIAFANYKKRQSVKSSSFITGLDRFIIMVKDIDEYMRFFQKNFGFEFQELDPEIEKRDGIRSCICWDARLHLIAPRYPLQDSLPPPMRRKIELLETQDYVVMALTFTVDDIETARSKLKAAGITVQEHEYKKSNDYASIGLKNFEEIMTYPEDTFDHVIGFAKYEK